MHKVDPKWSYAMAVIGGRPGRGTLSASNMAHVLGVETAWFVENASRLGIPAVTGDGPGARYDEGDVAAWLARAKQTGRFPYKRILVRVGA